MCRPYGAQVSNKPPFPPLKRGAIIFRPAERDSLVGPSGITSNTGSCHSHKQQVPRLVAALLARDDSSDTSSVPQSGTAALTLRTFFPATNVHVVIPTEGLSPSGGICGCAAPHPSSPNITACHPERRGRPRNLPKFHRVILSGVRVAWPTHDDENLMLSSRPRASSRVEESAVTPRITYAQPQVLRLRSAPTRPTPQDNNFFVPHRRISHIVIYPTV